MPFDNEPDVLELAHLALDEASTTDLERLELLGELAELVNQHAAASASGDALQLLDIADSIVALLERLGVSAGGSGAQAAAVEEGPQKIGAGDTAQFFEYTATRTKGQRQADNNAALELLAKIRATAAASEEVVVTAEEKAILAKYSGSGGGLVAADGLTGSTYEYYTPKPVAEAGWALLQELGFRGGKVLDPSAGPGIFGATAPANVVMDAVELDANSADINRYVNGSAKSAVTHAAFEEIAAMTPDETYDAIITNVPFGDASARGEHRFKDSRFQDRPLEAYFVLRSLQKLKPGGLACFILPPRCVSGRAQKEEDLRYQASLMAEFVGGYRLPNKVFSAASADTITDLVVFRKYSKAAAEKVRELSEQNPDVLREAKVLWDEFLSGAYFKGDGARFVLGQFVERDSTKVRDIDRVLSDDTVPNIAKLIRKFPSSRIDWELLGAAESFPIEHQEGDTVSLDGNTLIWKDGEWMRVPKSGADVEMARVGQTLTTALSALNAGVSWDTARGYYDWLRTTSKLRDCPDWLLPIMSERGGLSEGAGPTHWKAVLAGICVGEVMELHRDDAQFNYLTSYPILSDQFLVGYSPAKNPPSGLASSLKQALERIRIHYHPRRGYSAVWRGDVQADITVSGLTPSQRYEALKYRKGGDAITVEEMRKEVGEDFDPFADDDWCITANGAQLVHADDFYVGNYGEFLAAERAALLEAEDPAIREKLARQIEIAKSRIATVDAAKMTFNLASPLVSQQQKIDFLRSFVHPGFTLTWDEDGSPTVDFKGEGVDDEDTRNLKRFAEWVKTGTLGTRTSKADSDANPLLEKRRMATLRALVKKTQTQFNAYCQSSPLIQNQVSKALNDPNNVEFVQVENGAPLQIPGINTAFVPHDYQNAEIRRAARRFSGINGFDVGLGKTATTLCAVQYVHSIGVKRKTFIVVPNAVLSNWRREAFGVYTGRDDCLFIGMDVTVGKDGTEEVTINPENYARDFNRLRENRHRKIFMSFEAFGRIPLRGETLEAYERFVLETDSAYQAETKKRSEAEAKAGKIAKLMAGGTQKSGSIPFLEDMGVDSIVFDEGHAFKNSTQTVEFKGAKFLSLAEASARGLDAQAKCWYVRNKSPNADGVLVLTATPITNSPLEIYSMLSMAIGQGEVAKRIGGISGADAFMNLFCDIGEIEDVDLAGDAKLYDAFLGLQNVHLLSSVMGSVAKIKSAESVGLKIPGVDTKADGVDLAPETVTKLKSLQGIYRTAKKLISPTKAGQVPVAEAKAVAAYAAQTGQPITLLAHPFNLLNKMGLYIADPDMGERRTVYQALPGEKLDALITAFNAKGLTEKREHPTRWQQPEDIKKKEARYDSQGELKGYTYTVKVRAWTIPGAVALDTTSQPVQTAFEAMAEKMGVPLNVTLSPKLAALVANFKAEQANPKHGGRSKQLIFCDLLGLQNKIKLALVKHCGVPASKIKVVNGELITDPADMQDVQDGYNADGVANRYEVIILNKKGEVGINLQKGTQAIHHLTIGWTPDSIHQRNGRGVRQGNLVERVNEYHYDANGTFDETKRSLVGVKADWIGQVMDPLDDVDTVSISSGLSVEDMDVLIESIGDADALRKARSALAENERKKRIAETRANQAQNLDIVLTQREYQTRYETFAHWVADKIVVGARLRKQLLQVKARLANPMATEGAKAKYRTQIDILEAQFAELGKPVEAAYKVFKDAWQGSTRSVSFADLVMSTLMKGSSSQRREGEWQSYALSAAKNLSSRALEDSDLWQEFSEAIAASKGMAASAEATYNKLVLKEGAFKSETMQLAKDGDAVVVLGKAYVSGEIVWRNDAGGAQFPYVVDAKAKIARATSDRGTQAARRSVSVLALLPDTWSSVAPGEEGYDQALAKLAALDDAFIAENRENLIDKDARLYATILPAIMPLMKEKVQFFVSPLSVSIPAEYPIPLSPDLKGKSALVDRILEEQATLIVWGDGNRKIAMVDPNQTSRIAYTSVNRSKALVDYAIKFKLPLASSDLAVIEGSATLSLSNFHSAAMGHWSTLNGYGSFERAATASLTAAHPERDGFEAAAVAWFKDKVPPFVLTDDQAMYVMNYLGLQRVIQTLRHKLYPPPVATPAAPQTATDAPEPPQAPSDLVLLTGNTRPNKDTIKEYVTRYGTRKGSFKPSDSWDGDKAGWWISRKGYEALLADKPVMMQTIKVA